MKTYRKPSIRFAAFKNRTKTSLDYVTASAIEHNGSKMDPMSFKVRPLDPKVKSIS